MTEPTRPASFRLAYVPGVTPTKWVRVFRERRPDVPLELVAVDAAAATGLLAAGGADAALLRLPVESEGLSVIPLYEETPVVVVPKDHLFTAVDTVALADLDGEVLLHPYDDTLEWPARPGAVALHRPETTADATELVAAGAGLLIVPQSLARLHHRKDLTYRPVRDAPVSPIALAWLADETTDLIEEFVGIVRGRTVNSSRGAPQADTKRSASQKAAAKRASRQSKGSVPPGAGKATPRRPSRPGRRGGH
jgi:DNA-binding transcriptional LysR family regulator